MDDRPAISIRTPAPVAKAVLSREGDRYRVSALDAVGEAIEHLCRTLDTHKAAYGYAGGLRMTNRCVIVDLTAPEID